MISQWQVIERVLLGTFIVYFHVVVDCLLVRQMKVIFLVVSGAVGVTCDILFFVLAILSFYLSVHPFWRSIACSKWLQRLFVKRLL